MSEKHTQGRMVARAWTSHAKTTIGFEESDGNFMAIADVCDFGRLSEHDEQDARRLVACWNACEGIYTDDLEAMPAAYMLAKLQMVIPLFQEARDALTVVTEAQRKLHGISPTLADRMDEAGTFDVDDWRAAIAKVKGGAA